MLETRRQFLKKSVAMLGGAALLGSVPFAGAMAEGQTEAPAHPFPYAELDLTKSKGSPTRATSRTAAATASPRACWLNCARRSASPTR